jgi:hypothetical protein
MDMKINMIGTCTSLCTVHQHIHTYMHMNLYTVREHVLYINVHVHIQNT